MIVCISGLIHILILPISLQSIVLLEHRIYWYTYKDRYIQFMTRIMTVLHLTCLWWRDSDEVELQSKHSLQRGLTLSELHQGFTISGHQQLAGGWTFHSSNQYIQWKINCSNTVQTAEGPFSFLTRGAGKGVIALLVHPPSFSLLMLTVDRRQPNSGFHPPLTLTYCNSNTAQIISGTWK